MTDLLDETCTDAIDQILAVKLFSSESTHLNELESCGTATVKAGYWANTVEILEEFSSSIAHALCGTIIILICYYKLSINELTMGSFGAFIMFNGEFV